MGGGEISASAATHAETCLQRITELIGFENSRAVLADRFIEIVARYVRQAAFKDRATSEAVETVFMAGVRSANQQIEGGTFGTGVIGLLLAARRVSDQTLRFLKEHPDTLEEHSLSIYPAGGPEYKPLAKLRSTIEIATSSTDASRL